MDEINTQHISMTSNIAKIAAQQEFLSHEQECFKQRQECFKQQQESFKEQQESFRQEVLELLRSPAAVNSKEDRVQNFPSTPSFAHSPISGLVLPSRFPSFTSSAAYQEPIQVYVEARP